MEQHYPAHNDAPILFGMRVGYLMPESTAGLVISADEQERAVPVFSKRENKWFSSGSDVGIVGGFRKTYTKLD